MEVTLILYTLNDSTVVLVYKPGKENTIFVLYVLYSITGLGFTIRTIFVRRSTVLGG